MKRFVLIMDYDYKQVGQRFYPLIPVVVLADASAYEIHALVDSGSMISLFRMEVAYQLGIRPLSGKPINVASINGELLVYSHSLLLKIAGKDFMCHVGFSEVFTPNVNILGRIDFFENFMVLFDEKNKKVTLTPYA